MDALLRLQAFDREQIAAGKCSHDTLLFHQAKAGHLVRLFETNDRDENVPFRLNQLRAFHVDDYISKRREEEAKDTTIHKELMVLRKSLRLAIRAGLWRGRVEEVIPVAFSPAYEPRERALPSEEVEKLLAELPPDRGARVAFIVATSACWRETELALRSDVGEGRGTVQIRGTKRKTRFRTVPIVTPAQQSLLAYALDHAGGQEDLLFRRWGNVRRDLEEACERAGIERCSPNDLRRTFANWMVEAGVPLYVIAQMMGHKDTRMLERVYGRQTTEQLAALTARALRGESLLPGALRAAGPATPSRSADCDTVVPATLESAGLPGLDGQSAPTEVGTDDRPKNTEAPRTLQSTRPLKFSQAVVPGPGIEPGTRGFSVPCSTD
jgi:integrase